jgi:hypothetical protein
VHAKRETCARHASFLRLPPPPPPPLPLLHGPRVGAPPPPNPVLPHPSPFETAHNNIERAQTSLERGLVPDDGTLRQLSDEADSAVFGVPVAELRWPDDPLRAVLIRTLSTLGVARFAKKYPAVRQALLRGLLDLTVTYYKTGARSPGCRRRGLACCYFPSLLLAESSSSVLGWPVVLFFPVHFVPIFLLQFLLFAGRCSLWSGAGAACCWL